MAQVWLTESKSVLKHPSGRTLPQMTSIGQDWANLEAERTQNRTDWQQLGPIIPVKPKIAEIEPIWP